MEKLLYLRERLALGLDYLRPWPCWRPLTRGAWDSAYSGLSRAIRTFRVTLCSVTSALDSQRGFRWRINAVKEPFRLGIIHLEVPFPPLAGSDTRDVPLSNRRKKQHILVPSRKTELSMHRYTEQKYTTSAPQRASSAVGSLASPQSRSNDSLMSSCS